MLFLFLFLLVSAFSRLPLFDVWPWEGGNLTDLFDDGGGGEISSSIWPKISSSIFYSDELIFAVSSQDVLDL